MKPLILAVCIAAGTTAYTQEPPVGSYGQPPLPPEEIPNPVMDLAVSALTASLRDVEPRVRQAAVFALTEMAPASRSAIPVLEQTVRDPDAYIRIDAAHALYKLGQPSVPSLVRLLRDGDPRIRELAARTLLEMGDRAAEAIPALIQRLGDIEPRVRQAAVLALTEMGKVARSAIPALASTMRDPDSFVRIDAAHALAQLGPESIPSLVGLLQDNDERVRELTAETLREIAAETLSGTDKGRR